MRAAGHLAPEVVNLRIRELAQERPMAANLAQARGTRTRVRQGRMTESPAMLPGGDGWSKKKMVRVERGEHPRMTHPPSRNDVALGVAGMDEFPVSPRRRQG